MFRNALRGDRGARGQEAQQHVAHKLPLCETMRTFLMRKNTDGAADLGMLTLGLSERRSSSGEQKLRLNVARRWRSAAPEGKDHPPVEASPRRGFG